MEPDLVQQRLSEAISCDHIDVGGDGRHFEAMIVSAEFEGKSLVQRHQLVYKALGDYMSDDAVHAMSMKTLTPAEWSGQ
ncbi:BolA family protein [Magnetofaba australis]|uniref:Putative BolA family protein n=1 Tax=Magnetofaba australis IT-1 TaxID=1434232 RepID=A0A1Y2K159_9PROT|nr:BolA family protein [Magnetofaba australis]OSM01679.1 putative BolA family protein [Magnetofaba australis IT-1]